MPIVDVEIVLLLGESLRSGLVAAIADRCGEVFGSPPGHTWVKVRVIPDNCYAESGDGPADGVRPVFVSVLKARLPGPDALRGEIARLSAVIAEVVGRPIENVHIAYLPAGAGRMAFGGELVLEG